MASIHFYRFYLKNNDEVTDFNFLRLIDDIWENHNSRQRTIKIDEYWYSMSAYSHPIENV